MFGGGKLVTRRSVGARLRGVGHREWTDKLQMTEVKQIKNENQSEGGKEERPGTTGRD